MLFPPDLRDWVQEDDVVHFVLDVAYRVSTDLAQVNQRGTGSAQYPPSIMLALLLYCYSQGIYSSRNIERATYSHVSVRFLTADHHPGHDTIAAFRRRNKDFIQQAFVTTLHIAREVGLSQFGTMAIDGTSLRASAGKKSTCRFDELEQKLTCLCEEALQKAEEADELSGQTGQRLSLPTKETLEVAHAKIKAKQEERKKQRDAMCEEVREVGVGTPPLPMSPDVNGSKTINWIDPDCHIMLMKEGYYSAGYNGQLAVDTESRLITAALISSSSIDMHQLRRVAQSSQRHCHGSVKTVVADSGYDNNHHIYQLDQDDGIEAIVGVKDPHRLSTKHLQTKRRQRTRKLKLQRLKVLETQRAKSLMRQRKSTVETVFGTIKHAMQFRGFLQRGQENVANEWNLISTAFNLKRMVNLGVFVA